MIWHEVPLVVTAGSVKIDCFIVAEKCHDGSDFLTFVLCNVKADYRDVFAGGNFFCRGFNEVCII